MPRFIQEIDPNTTAILVIDMSNDFVSPNACEYDFVPSGNQFAPKLNQFLNTCREKKFKQIIYVTHCFRADCKDMTLANRTVMGIYPAGDQYPPSDALVDHTKGIEIYEACAPKKDEILVKKHQYSAFNQTNLDVILRSNQIKTVVITGVCLDCCCSAAARDAFCLDYDVVILADLNGTAEWLTEDRGYGAVPLEKVQIATLNSLFATCGDVMSSEQFLELIPRSL